MMNWNVITYAQKISAFLFNTSVDLHKSPTAFNCCNIISYQWWSNLIWFMNEKLFNVKLSKIPPHNTWYDCVYTPASTLYSQKNDILDSWLIACCKRPPTLARQMWRHNDVIGRNEYLISTFSETTFPWVYSLQFLFKSTHHSWRYKRKCEWVFFFWTQCILKYRKYRDMIKVIKIIHNTYNSLLIE